MATQVEQYNPVNAFIQGRDARQQYDYGQSRNAMAQLDAQNAPREMQQRNALLDSQVQGAQQDLDANKAKYAYTQLAQALDSGNPRAAVLQNIPDLAAKLKQQGHDLNAMDDQQASQLIDGLARQMAGKAGIMPRSNAEESYTLKPGEARYAGGKVVAERPANPGDASGFTLSPGQTRYGPDGKPVASSAAKLDPTQVTDIEGKLRNEYTQLSKEFRSVADSYQRIKDSASDPSPAGDLSLIFNYMKVLDPGSTVREGEFATAQNAGSVGDRVLGLYNRILNGERLAPAQREDFLGRSTKLYKGQETRHTKTVKARYEGLAKSYGVDPQNVTVDINAEPEQPTQAAAPQAQEPTATGPNGKKLVLRNNQWVPL